MAKWIVRATTYGSQMRLALPKGLVRKMGWKDGLLFILKKEEGDKVTVKQIFTKRDLE